MTETSSLAIDHLLLRLGPINRALRKAVKSRAESNARLVRPDVKSLCITEDHANRLINSLDSLIQKGKSFPGSSDFIDEEEQAEKEIQALADENGIVLPLNQMVKDCELDSFEEQSILICAAYQIDSNYERIFAFILDDLTRKIPCIELLSSLTAKSLREQLMRQQALGPFGRLRRCGILVPVGESPSELKQELKLVPGIFENLIRPGYCDLNFKIRDSAEVSIEQPDELPPGIDSDSMVRLGQALRDGKVSIIGLWEGKQNDTREVLAGIAHAAKRKLRKLSLEECANSELNLEFQIRQALEAAAALNSILWIDIDPLRNLELPLSNRIVNLLTRSNVPLFLSGTLPWRPTNLLKLRTYQEIELRLPSYKTSREMWTREFPEIGDGYVSDLASRFRINRNEIRAIAQVARTQAILNGNGTPASVEDQLENALAMVLRKKSYQFAVVAEAKRGAKDLILPDEIHQQVLEVSRFFRTCSKVDEIWGFGRIATGKGGIKALFTGDSGTGKTLAAEVIASELNYPLLKVDLARVVSKWVGDTEKNLEAVFQEAEESNAVLFFDEADALFGKRGEVQHGTDRYANLEVGYLLQRLEDYYGLVILSSNLKDQIDAAFTRRFQIVIHFPRPRIQERRRIWRLALPESAPLDTDIDFGLLERLDLTGAGIVSASRMAAMLAAEGGDETISMHHLAKAISRQYQRESRVLSSSELGSYAPVRHQEVI